MNITEANESTNNKVTALQNLQGQIIKGEGMGVISMYEEAALSLGASSNEIQSASQVAYLIKKIKSKVMCRFMGAEWRSK